MARKISVSEIFQYVRATHTCTDSLIVGHHSLPKSPDHGEKNSTVHSSHHPVPLHREKAECCGRRKTARRSCASVAAAGSWRRPIRYRARGRGDRPPARALSVPSIASPGQKASADSDRSDFFPLFVRKGERNRRLLNFTRRASWQHARLHAQRSDTHTTRLIVDGSMLQASSVPDFQYGHVSSILF